MNTFRFKTNINCGSCIKAVTPFLNGIPSLQNWEVDTANPDKILTVQTTDADAQAIQKMVEEAGFSAEVLS